MNVKRDLFVLISSAVIGGGLPALVLSAPMAATPSMPSQTAQAMKALAAAPVLQQAVVPAGPGRQRKMRLLRTDGRYPLIAEETVQTAAGRILDYHSVVADHLIVRLRAGRQRADLLKACAQRGWAIRQALPIPGFYLVAIAQPGMKGLRSAAEALIADDALIQSVETDALIWGDAVPNDPDFGLLYGMNNTGQFGGTTDADIDAPEAWDQTRGATNTIVAVIDSGIDLDHPDLVSNLWENAGETGLDQNGADKRTNGVDDDGNGYVDDVYGWDFYNNDNSPDDDHGHGTHCAGTIGATGNNGLGVAGVCWTTRLMPLKFLGANNSGPSSAAASAIYYAVNNGAKVLSCSWGSSTYNSALAAAIDKIQSMALLVAAAGNDGTDNDVTAHYPSSCANANILSVAASDWNDALAYFSNYGAASVDLSAPGYYTYSTLTNGLYGYKSGTSMAVPHVSGAAALLWNTLPNASVSRIRNALLAGVDSVASQSGKTVTGGRLNVNKALAQLVFAVDQCVPADGGVTSAPPDAVILSFSDAVSSSGLRAEGLTVNGVAANDVEVIESKKARYTFAASPVTDEGLQSLALADGAAVRAADGAAVRAFSGSFYYDTLRLSATNILPAAGLLTNTPAVLRLAFNEPVDPQSVSLGNLSLSAGTVVSAEAVSSTEIAYGVDVPSLDGTWTVTVNEGALRDRNECPGTASRMVYTFDLPVSEFAGPWRPAMPFGTHVYTNAISGEISAAGDTDNYWLRVDATQCVSVAVIPDASLTPRIWLETASGVKLAEASATTAGTPVVLTADAVPGGSACILSIADTGSGRGTYALRAALSALQETEAYDGAGNDTVAAAVDLNAFWKTWTGTGCARKLSVIGHLEKSGSLKLYDVDFATPPHTLGSRPAIGIGSAPRKTLYAVSFGSPTVVSGVGPITSQCLNLNAGGQIRLSVGRYGYFSRDYTSCRLSFDAVIMPPGDGLTILCDCPEVRNIYFESAGTIRFWSPLGYGRIGSFTPGQCFHMDVLVDQANDSISIWKDGVLLTTKYGMNIETIRSFRFSTLYETNTVGLDNIVISTQDGSSVGSDEDWFTFDCDGRAPISAVLHAVDPVSTVTVQALEADGATTLATAACSGGDAVLSAAAPPQGRVYLRVQGQASSYQLCVLEDACLEVEPNATQRTATESGTAAVLAARLAASGTQDWFAVTLTNAVPVRLDTATPGDGAYVPDNTVVPRLDLFDRAGSLLATATNNAPDGRNAVLAYLPQTLGLYYICLSSQSGEGDVEIRRSESAMLSLVLSTNEVAEGETDSLTGDVCLSAALTKALSVVLTSSNPRRLALPCALTIPAGETHVAFDVQIVDNDDLDGLADVRITASGAGCVAGSAGVRVHDNEQTTLSLFLPAGENENAGVITNAGRLVLGRTAAAALTVSLTSSDTGELVVPASVVIPAGASEALFDLTVVDELLNDGDQTVTVTASLPDLNRASGSMTVWDDDHLDLRILPASSVLHEGAGLVSPAGRILITCLTTNDVAIDLSSSAPAALAPVKRRMVIPAGAMETSFDVHVGDDAECQGRRAVVLSAALPSGGSTNTVFTLIDNDIDHLQFGAIGNRQTSGIPFSVGVSYRTVDDDLVADADDHEVEIGTKSRSIGMPRLLTDSRIVLTNGVWQGEISLLGYHGSCALTAYDAAGRKAVSSSFALLSPVSTVTPACLSDIRIVLNTEAQRELVITNTGPAPLLFRWREPRPAWLSLSVTNGVVEPQAAKVVRVTFDSTGFQYNEQVSTTLALLSNDAASPTNEIPVGMTVIGPDLRAFATAPAGVLAMGQSFVLRYAVTNAGLTSAAFSIASFYLSKDTVLDDDDWAFDYADYVSPLAAGTHIQRSTYLELPDASAWLGSSAYLLVQADAFNWVDEGVCESNNVYAVPVAFTRDSAALVLTPLAATNIVVPAGDVFLKTFCVSNAGQQSLEFALRGLPDVETAGAASSFWSVGATTSSVAPSAAVPVYVLFDARACAPGFYGTAVPELTSNDPLCPSVALPLAMGVPALPPTMVSEPSYTVGISNVVSWTAMTGAGSYLCECSPLANGQRVSQNTVLTFGPLADRTPYRYRVCSITEFPFGAVTSDWSSATLSLQLAPDADYDGDGVPNQWEADRGLSPTVLSDASKDWDGDGMSNAEEYQADTDPTNETSRLGFVSVIREADGLHFAWRGGNRATQILEATTSLTAHAVWTALYTNQPPTETTNVFILTAPENGDQMRFLRVRAFRP